MTNPAHLIPYLTLASPDPHLSSISLPRLPTETPPARVPRRIGASPDRPPSPSRSSRTTTRTHRAGNASSARSPHPTGHHRRPSSTGSLPLLRSRRPEHVSLAPARFLAPATCAPTPELCFELAAAARSAPAATAPRKSRPRSATVHGAPSPAASSASPVQVRHLPDRISRRHGSCNHHLAQSPAASARSSSSSRHLTSSPVVPAWHDIDASTRCSVRELRSPLPPLLLRRPAALLDLVEPDSAPSPTHRAVVVPCSWHRPSQVPPIPCWILLLPMNLHRLLIHEVCRCSCTTTLRRPRPPSLESPRTPSTTTTDVEYYYSCHVHLLSPETSSTTTSSTNRERLLPSTSLRLRLPRKPHALKFASSR